MRKALLTVASTATRLRPWRLIAFLFSLSGLLVSAPAYSHDWYPHDCCNDKDCAPVESLRWVFPRAGADP